MSVGGPSLARAAAIGAVGLGPVLAALAGCDGEAGPAERPPVRVFVATPEVRAFTSYYHYSGFTAAVEDVEVRARVAGELESLHFTPSTDVSTGDLLFVIEPDVYEAELASAEAEAARAEAALDLARVERDRVVRAFRRDAATEQERLEYEASVRQREAELDAALAAVDRAEIQLGYTRVTAPITGRVNRELVDVGNLVGQNESTLLTTIVAMQPMHAYFDVSEKIVQEYIERGRRGDVGAEAEPPTVELARSIDPPGRYPFRGRIDFVEPQVDPDTGTMRVRGVFDNADGQLFPGLFVRARVPYDVRPDATLILQDAVGSALDGSYVYVVDGEDRVQRRSVTLGETDGPHVVVTDGLGPDDRYVVRGIQRVRPGQAVDPAPLDAASGPVPTPSAEGGATPEAPGA